MRYLNYDANNNSGFNEPEAGTYIARIVKLIDLGTQKKEFQGRVSFSPQLWVQFELPSELVDTTEGQKPAVVSKFYSLSLFEKATLRQDLETLRGKAFTQEELQGFITQPLDLGKLLGLGCMISLVPNEKGKIKVKSVLKLPAGQKCPPPVNEYAQFWLDEQKKYFDEKTFALIPDGIKKIIMQSPEWKELQSQHDDVRPVFEAEEETF